MDPQKIWVFATKVPFSNLLLVPWVLCRFEVENNKRGALIYRDDERRHHVPLIPKKHSDGSEMAFRIGGYDKSRGHSTHPQQRRPASSDGGTGHVDADYWRYMLSGRVNFQFLL